MIDPKELRIGNWVNREWIKLDPITKYWEYDQIDALDFEDIDCFPERFNSISLTPDILEKCGFTPQYFEDKISYYNYQGMAALTIKEGIVDVFDLGNNKPIKYLHQLQNAWYIKEGEELNYKS